MNDWLRLFVCWACIGILFGMTYVAKSLPVHHWAAGPCFFVAFSAFFVGAWLWFGWIGDILAGGRK